MKLQLGSPPSDGDPFSSFIIALQAAGAGEGTVKLYTSAIKSFLDFVEKDPRKVTQDDINRWIVKLMSQAKDKRSRSVTLRYYTIAIRRFLRWLGVNITPVLPRARRKEVRAIREEEAKKLIDSTKRLRDKVIIRLLLETGLRSKELLSISKNDIDMERLSIHVRETKNGEERIVFFTVETKNLLERYMRKENGEKLFNLSYQALYRLIRRSGKRIGIEGLRPHMLRHTFATTAIRKGVPLPAVQRLMGHKDIKTTQIYTHLVTEDLERVYRNAFT
ncbi:site-specific tyrosine recombinase/integron integrase [Candidatus Acidianus copahuensis]|uniref:Tyrosine recombinase XerA n=1 Tax=Candidatus Acidianus copahuensis TaxID=1160895 RepID=A0A031LQ84_9CREN|nr:site-specific tyrosine recombinase/integron integrase [Candidatus Acidianus copahuensis]EZQ06880.1 recombinase XerD [Candidatus Acidianus copahuensis]NON62849.1 tyrosine-type recombinase/integrase [Acidianus sp. RZ1]